MKSTFNKRFTQHGSFILHKLSVNTINNTNMSYSKANSNEVYISIEESSTIAKNNQHTNENKNEVEYSFQDNLIHFDYDTGHMIHNYTDGTTRYKGEWSKGCPNGNGTMYYKDGSIAFEGKMERRGI